MVSYRVSLEATKSDEKPTFERRRDLETALGRLLTSFARTRQQLRRREAELAASVPVVSVEDDGEHLAERLQNVLRASVDMLQCSKSGLYMLDEATTSLKLRTHLGLDGDALLQPARRLEDCVADIEAMAGHAVVIDQCRPSSHWNVPETCASAICVPVSSATTILGTLWFFRETERDFAPTEQSLAEITAGRIAADLERAVLVQEVRSLRARKTMAPSVSTDFADTPKVAPVLEGWEVADAQTTDLPCTSFSHWRVADDDRLHLGVGASGATPAETVTMQAMHAAHTQHDPSVGGVLSHVNQSLWAASTDGANASLFHGLLDPGSGSLQYAVNGGVFAYVLRPHGWEPLLAGTQTLGADAEIRADVHRQVLMPGDALVVMNGGQGSRGFDQDHVMNQVAEKLLRNTHLPAAELAAVAAKTLERKFASDSATSFSVVVAKRADESR